MDGQKIWNSALTNFKGQFSSSTYRAWFAGSHALEFKKQGESNLLIIGVPNGFVKEQLERRYRREVSSEIEKLGIKSEVVFVVSQKQSSAKAQNEPIFSGEPSHVLRSTGNPSLMPTFNFGNFVVGFSNNLAYLAATQVAREPGRVYNPLLVYGPTGVGKTHLLQAIGNEILLKTADAKVLYISVERFTNEFIESLRNKTQEQFRQKYRKADVLLVDDIQFLAGKESTQDEFFFTINELILAGRQIVCASDRHPKELGKVKERLVSRFLGGMAADIGTPDLEMKMAIVTAKCREKEVNLQGDIVAFIAQSCDGGARELEGALISVLAQIKLNGGNVDLDSIALTIANKKTFTRPTVTPGKIIDGVCRHFKVKSADLCGSSRKANLVRARQMLMFMLRRELDLPLVQIGQLVGGRDHSTIIHGIEKVNKWQAQSSGSDEILRIQSLIFS